jgi:hypothetical protein
VSIEQYLSFAPNLTQKPINPEIETRQHQFEPTVRDQLNQSLIEKSSRQIPQAPLPRFLPPGVFEHMPRPEPSH